MVQLRRSPSAGVAFCTFLLAVTPNFAQQIVRSAETHSIISLAPARRPQGELLARHPGEATFASAPSNYHVFAAATAGKDAGVETLTLNFAGDTRLTRIQSKNKDFVVESGGTCLEGSSYARGQSCTLLVRFNPQGAGHRLGFVTVANTAEPTPMSFGLLGNGFAPVVSFTPAQITTVPGTVSSGVGTISSSTNLAVDGGDIIYIADTKNSFIKEIDSSGKIDSIPSSFANPASVAVDSFGMIYILGFQGSANYFMYNYPSGTQIVSAPPYAPGACTVNAPCPLAKVGMGAPANLSIDPNDNLFFEEQTQGAAEMPVGSVAASSGLPVFNLWYLSDTFAYANPSPTSFAVDATSNLYTADLDGNVVCWLLEEPLTNAEHSPTAKRVAGASTCGFSGDGGQARGAELSTSIGQIAFDIAGNLYFADTGNQRIRRIDRSTGIINTIAGNGNAGFTGDNGPATNATLSNPTGVTVDSQGQVYILSNAPTAGPTQALRVLGVKGEWGFGSVLKGTTSPVKVFSVANTGNDALQLAADASFIGLNPGDFAISPGNTTCHLTANSILEPTQSCTIGIAFAPSAAGGRGATLRLLDNTVTGSNLILLNGTGILSAPTMTITAPNGGSSVSSGTTVTFSVSVTSSTTTKPTGTVTFKVNGSAIGSPVTLSVSGTASTTFSESTPNTYTLSAVYSGDSNFASATKSESLIVTALKTPVTVGVTVH